MSKKPGDWWDRSWTLVEGCTWPEGEMPAACERCWARGMARRWRPEQLAGVRVREDRLGLPAQTRKPTVFACQINYGDLFHPEVQTDFIAEAFGSMVQRHTFVLLTKRPKRAADALRGICLCAGEDPPPNMILLASVWDQESTNAACAALAELPRSFRWGLHMEPLLGPVDMRKTGTNRIDGSLLPSWIVVGGENGPGARPMDPDWVRTIRDQCHVARVPFWLKGLGGGKAAGRLLDGREYNEVPW